MREYKIGTGWAIFAYVITAFFILLCCLALSALVDPATAEKPPELMRWILCALFGSMILLMLWLIAEIAIGKFVMDHEKVYTSGVFTKRQLLFNEIKGYRIGSKYIEIEPISKEKKKINVSLYYGDTDEIKKWLASYYPDLDALQAAEDEARILGNDAFGDTIQEREQQLKKARLLTIILNCASGLAAGWVFIYPEPYELAIFSALIMPIIILLVIKFFKGLIRIDEERGGAYPSLMLGFLLSSIAILLKGISDFNIFEYHNVWLPLLLLVCALLLLLLTGGGRLKLKKAEQYFIFLVFFIFIIGYSHGALLFLNSSLDNSKAVVYKATILNKRESSGKNSSYHFSLTPWGPRKKIKEISVSKDLYRKIETGNTVNIYFSKGLFDIPWFKVEEEE